MNNKLFNSQGKQLYTNPESIKKAKGRRKDVVFGKGSLKYKANISLFAKEPIHVVTL